MPKENTDFFQKFIERLKDRNVMPFDEFVDLALYHPLLGYYSKAKQRVGKNDHTDFYTSCSSGSLWGQLIVDACIKILKSKNLEKYTFVEIAAEPNCSILKEVDHPFNTSTTYRLGDSIKIPKNAIVFSNEWLDARPFKRFKFNGKKNVWDEIGVSFHEGEFIECFLATNFNHIFPKKSIPGYTIDWSTGAFESIESILSQPWSGLFLTFDYGLSKHVLFNERPEGTARGYFKHQIVKNILNQPGEQDLTCHLCWDELIKCLQTKGFSNPKLENQESFLMHHSQNKIKKILENSRGSLKIETQKLKELIHPQYFGNKFQALWGQR